MTDVRTSGEVRCLGPFHLVVLAAWCGLAAGELEVAARIVHRTFGSTHRLFLMTRHFVWLVPLVNLALFLGVGVLLALATRLWPRRAGWLEPAALRRPGHPAGPDLAGPRIYVEAWLLLALGVAPAVAPVLERHAGPLAAAAAADRPGPAGAGAGPGRLVFGATGSSGGARRAAPCPRPARPMSC